MRKSVPTPLPQTRNATPLAWVAALAAVVLLQAGCPTVPTDGNNNNNNNDNTPGGEVTAAIVNFNTNFGVSALQAPVSALYTVTGTPTSIAGFFVPVADNSSGAAPIGDRVIVATNLPAGAIRSFSFDPRVAGVGFFRVGVLVVADGDDIVDEGNGVVQVQGQPAPFFVQPSLPLTEVAPGADVAVAFDAGDPEGDVQWRLFYLRDTDSRAATPDQLGSQIMLGSGNVGAGNFSTAGLNAGDYQLGVSATDTGLSIGATVTSGQTSRVVTEFGPTVRVRGGAATSPPRITFTAPGATDVGLFRNETFLIRFTVTISEPGATGLMELFYDDDLNVRNGFRGTIINDLPATATSHPLPTNLPEGTWFLGATVRTVGGLSAPVTAYATGRISVVRNVTLAVTDPDSALPFAPGAAVPIAWTTNAPAAAGVVDVFARAIDPNTGLPTASIISILANAPMTTRTATFTRSISGIYEISVRLEFVDGTSRTATAPERVRISSLPAILWLGSITDDEPPFEGAILGGVNFEDNAGSTLSSAGDLNGDGRAELVVGARYGKPQFVNPSGIGPGEAYVVHGLTGAEKLVGEFNLNSVGTPSLPGVTLTGIPTRNNNDETEGLALLTTIPDNDGDLRSELVFGFPNTDSAGATVGSLEAAGQFLNGGIVILSSNNTLLESPTTGSPVINLNAVGQLFTDMSIQPAAIGTVLLDTRRFQTDTCTGGTDTVLDTIVGPAIGFVDFLAPPRWQQIGFTILTGSPSNLNCPTLINIPVGTCSPSVFSGQDAGSGFYPTTGAIVEPRGARILGPGSGERFGTSITTSNALGGSGPVDLLITAPTRTARAADVEGLGSDRANAGIAFLTPSRDLTAVFGGRPAPRPHQYIMDSASHCGDNRADGVTALNVAGGSAERIEHVLGLADFNGDGRNDFAVGAPAANNGQGRLYVCYRRERSIEGDYVLEKLALAPNDPERLTGMLISPDSIDGLGSSLATDVDFNGDGLPDLVIGIPNANNGTGEVLIVFSNTGVVTPLNGISVTSLLQGTRTSAGRPVAARIRGNVRDPNGLFGFNVANAGDVNGDGKNDLLIAAPGATPRFDENLADATDELTLAGLDLNFDGAPDDVSGPRGVPDGLVDGDDQLLNAGLVYVIDGTTRLDNVRTCSVSGRVCAIDLDCPSPEVCTGATVTIGVDQLGSSQLRGFMIAGRREGDRLGGGDAGDAGSGGIGTKMGRGRSRGLASAGDVDGDGRADILIGSILADPRLDPNTGQGVQNGGEAYLIFGTAAR